MTAHHPTAPTSSRRAAWTGRALRQLPAGLPGKARLGRRLLGARAATRPAWVTDQAGNRLYLPNLVEPVGFHLWLDGVYEPESLDFLRTDLAPTDTVLDIGANVGCFAMPLSLAVPDGRVVAFEASPTIVQHLQHNVEANDRRNVTVVACAATAGQSPTVPFYEAPADHFGMGSIAPQFGAAPIQVPARRVDDVLHELGLGDVSTMKVDVEGYEADVFRGAEALLTSRARPRIIFEFYDWAEERAFPAQKGLAQRVLFDCGYRLWTLPAYLAGAPNLSAPVVDGGYSIVALHLP